MFGKRSTEPSPRELTPFERRVFEVLSERRSPSITLISLSRQLKAFLQYRPARNGPEWLPRQMVSGYIVIRPGLFVGAEWGFGTSAISGWANFALFDEETFRGSASFMVGQAVSEMRFHFPGLTRAVEYPAVSSLVVAAIQEHDERPYWNERISGVPVEMKDLATEVATTVERGYFERNVVVPTPIGITERAQRIHGISIPESYRALLRWANGVRVNRLSILGAEDLFGRVFDLQGDRFLKIGEDEKQLYVLKGSADTVGDEVWALPHGSRRPDALGVDVVGLCRGELA
ncbi:MAG: hypothetical protein IPN83_18915 [Holophagales bacterium]|nr:hypothetical protein [Holophagales bacterium]